MAATLEQLINVRSQAVEAMLAYLRAMEDECAKNPLLDRFGRRLDDLRVPLRVVEQYQETDLPEMLKPIDLLELKEFFLNLSKQLLLSIKPEPRSE